MKRLASIILFFIFVLSLCGCDKEEIITYDLNIISPSFENVYSHYIEQESDTEKYILSSASSYAEYLTEETLPVIESLTVCDENISQQIAQEIVDICNLYDIPVFFLMNDIPAETIDSYDKAFCITADYTYIGEIFAEKINLLWEDVIIDKDGDRIFTFSVVKPENLNNIQQSFYESLIKNIELLGIPLEQLEEIFLTKGDVLSYCTDNKKANEAFIILESNYLSVFPEGYEPYQDGIEILGIEFGVENIYADYPYMLLCFIDYTQYFDARDAVLANIDAKVYPFKNLEYNLIEKNIYIQPVI